MVLQNQELTTISKKERQQTKDPEKSATILEVQEFERERERDREGKVPAAPAASLQTLEIKYKCTAVIAPSTPMSLAKFS